jgi:hypothetical protein
MVGREANEATRQRGNEGWAGSDGRWGILGRIYDEIMGSSGIHNVYTK